MIIIFWYVIIFADTGERILVEVQMHREPLLERNILAISQDLATSFSKGSNSWELRRDFPTVYVINIMNFVMRKDNDDYIQPIKLMYTKPPQKTAFDNLQIFNIELPKFRAKEHDLSKPLDAWLYILDTAEQEQKSVEEVVSMNSRLQETLQNDPGIQQFMENYERISADPSKREEYISYAKGIYYFNGVLRGAVEEGMEKGMTVGIAKGMEKGKLEDAKKMLSKKYPITDISDITGLPIETIRSLTP